MKMIRIKWVETGAARLVSVERYLAMDIDELEGTLVRMIEIWRKA